MAILRVKDADGNVYAIPAIKGDKGDPGTVFTPSVDEDGNLNWTNDGKLNNPETVNIRGPQGDSGVYVGSGAMPDGYNVQVDLVSEEWVPFIEETVTTETIFDEETIGCAGLSGDLSALEVGCTYQVTFAGEVYEFEAYKVTAEGFEYICLGDAALVCYELMEPECDSNDSAPFGVMYDATPVSGGSSTIYTDVAGTYSISVAAAQTVAALRVKDAAGKVVTVPFVGMPLLELVATLDDGTTQTYTMYGEAVTG